MGPDTYLHLSVLLEINAMSATRSRKNGFTGQSCGWCFTLHMDAIGGPTDRWFTHLVDDKMFRDEEKIHYFGFAPEIGTGKGFRGKPRKSIPGEAKSTERKARQDAVDDEGDEKGEKGDEKRQSSPHLQGP